MPGLRESRATGKREAIPGNGTADDQEMSFLRFGSARIRRKGYSGLDI